MSIQRHNAKIDRVWFQWASAEHTEGELHSLAIPTGRDPQEALQEQGYTLVSSLEELEKRAEDAREILSGGPFVQFMDQDPRMCQLLTERLGIEVRPGGTPLGLPNAYLHGDDILLVVRVKEEEDGLLFTLFQKVSWAREINY